MYLTDLTILGVTLPVDVATDGVFSATFEGATYNAGSLATLTLKLRRVISSFQTAVPFVLPNGKRGDLHGRGPTGETMLVIWSDGKRDAIALDTAVFPPEAATPEVLAELASIHDQIAALRARQTELLAATVTASVLYENMHPPG